MIFIGLCQWRSTSISILMFLLICLRGELYIDVYMNTFLFTNTLYSLALIFNTNIGSVVNDEVVVMGITLEYHRSNDGGSYPKFCFCLK